MMKGGDKMDREQIVHDLAMACLRVQTLPPSSVLVEETVQDYLEKSAIIREILEKRPDE